jgi:hypothetical protein
MQATPPSGLPMELKMAFDHPPVESVCRPDGV